MLLVFGLCLLAAVGSLGAPAEDLIENLPGLPGPAPFKQYSGYLNGVDGKQLHYWFVESSNNPTDDPVVLWMNGGPGCSSMEGMLAELGPFSIGGDGKTLIENPFAWSTIANMIFLEAPVCVGYSYDPNGDCDTGDDETSLSNYLALQDFFGNKFPEYRNNSFFITGESYAGIYVPTLTVRVLEGMDNFSINLQGYAVGNGLSSYDQNDDSIIFFAYYHGLFGDDLWQRLVSHCCTGHIPSKDTCNFHDSYWPLCVRAVRAAADIVYNQGLNMYNLYDNCATTASSSFVKSEASLSNVFRKHEMHQELLAGHRQSLTASASVQGSGDPPCTNETALADYMNSPEVRAALHIPDNVQAFQLCNMEVNENFKREYKTMAPQYKYLTTKVRGLVYNGDIDMACNFLGDEWFVEDLGLKVLAHRRAWHSGGQIGGWVKRFANLDLLTIRGAGHMVPEDKPQPALHMIQAFLQGADY